MDSDREIPKLTRKEARALWYAVDCAKLMLREAKRVPGITQAQLDNERARVDTANRALFKVRQIIRAQKEQA